MIPTYSKPRIFAVLQQCSQVGACMNVGDCPWQLRCRVSVDVVPKAASCDLVDFCKCPTRFRRISNFNQLFLFPLPFFFRLVAIVLANLLACSYKLRLATSISVCTSIRRHLEGRGGEPKDLRFKAQALKPQASRSVLYH
jgi:hypothetical protein